MCSLWKGTGPIRAAEFGDKSITSRLGAFASALNLMVAFVTNPLVAESSRPSRIGFRGKDPDRPTLVNHDMRPKFRKNPTGIFRGTDVGIELRKRIKWPTAQLICFRGIG